MLPELILLGVGAIVGVGIFVLTGIAAADYAGPGLVLSFLIAGLASGLAALCYAEFASMVPFAGLAYTYSYITLGEFFAWFIGWDLILEYSIFVAAIAIGWSGYMVSILSLFGIVFPAAYATAPGSGGIINLPAMAIILLVTGISYIGVTSIMRWIQVETLNRWILFRNISIMISPDLLFLHNPENLV